MAKDAMSKATMVDVVAEANDMTKSDARAAVDTVFQTISDTLQGGGKVQITGFGTFEVRERKARTGVKPGTNEKIDIPASKYPAFKPGKSLKDTLK